MGNRKKTRTIRVEMTRTGENYTRSAAAVGYPAVKASADQGCGCRKPHP